MGVFLKSELPPRPVYAIEKSTKPQSLVELPMVHIDHLIIESEMTIEVAIDKAREALSCFYLKL